MTPARAALALLILAGPAAAQDAASPALADLLGRLDPARAGAFAVVADPVAAAAVDARANLGGWPRLAVPGFESSLLPGLEGAWEPLVGFGPEDVAALAVAGDPPDALRLLLLAPGAAARVGPALLANGYAEGPPGSFARGLEDYALDLAARDPADPFGGDLGQASRVAVRGDVVAQGAAWTVVAEGAGLPEAPALLAAIEAVARPGERLVQVVLPRDPGEGTALAAPPGGRWRTALADLSDGATDRALAVRLLDARAEAEGVAAAMAAAWAETPSLVDGRVPAEAVGAPGTPRVVGEGPFAAVLEVATPVDPAARRGGAGFTLLLRALWARDPGVLAARP